MSARKLVSVVTGTYNRHELLMGAIENIREQTYPNIEHIIVADGPDPDLMMKVADAIGSMNGGPKIRYFECGRNWTTYLANSRNAAPIIVAQLLARGEYITWLADDERGTPDHIESLVDALEAAGADFAYSQTDCYWVGRPNHRWVIGTDPPQCGQITNVLYRAKLLEKGLTRLGADPCPDWDQISSWMTAGARWAYVPRVTFEHRADQ
jgi:glycosyltransferase involved in cell wall biosynthesis